MYRRFRSFMHKYERGEAVEPYRGQSFASPELLRRFLSSERFRLLKLIRAVKPTSVYGLAKAAERNRMAVTADLNVLKSMGLVRFVKTKGPGRRRTVPEVTYSKIRIAIDL
ncbi:MAG TPA: ArsR family transcriptional regulator [Candidatus Thermoplasmatota archaeon]|nr:ArsR family transcriptional regulator [Candidatus Thermoplasmatota archaeon]